ncbi:MAG: peptidylprolyl isomerase [archaeon]
MKAKTGNTVKVDYVGTTEGKMFDTSIKEEAEKGGIYNEQRPYEPLEFEVGAGQMIQGFDKAVQGMEVGEEKTVDIAPGEAYGEYNHELIKELPLESLKDNGITPETGQKIQLMTPQGPLTAIVKEITDDKIILDFNHELAGKTLTFKIILREIK